MPDSIDIVMLNNLIFNEREGKKCQLGALIVYDGESIWWEGLVLIGLYGRRFVLVGIEITHPFLKTSPSPLERCLAERYAGQRTRDSAPHSRPVLTEVRCAGYTDQWAERYPACRARCRRWVSPVRQPAP